MQRATTLIFPPDQRLMSACRVITLTREDRYRRRVALTTDCGKPFLLDLAEAAYILDGTGLLIDTGHVILVRAAAEPLLEITANSALVLSRIAWHIGNRHTPAEMTETAIYIQPDHVLADMVHRLDGKVSDVRRPFEPEGGAYGGHGSLERNHHHHQTYDPESQLRPDGQGHRHDRAGCHHGHT